MPNNTLALIGVALVLFAAVVWLWTYVLAGWCARLQVTRAYRPRHARRAAGPDAWLFTQHPTPPPYPGRVEVDA